MRAPSSASTSRDNIMRLKIPTTGFPDTGFQQPKKQLNQTEVKGQRQPVLKLSVYNQHRVDDKLHNRAIIINDHSIAERVAQVDLETMSGRSSSIQAQQVFNDNGANVDGNLEEVKFSPSDQHFDQQSKINGNNRTVRMTTRNKSKR